MNRRMTGWTILAICSVALFSLLPVLWQALTSIKPTAAILSVPLEYFPQRFTLDHYHNLFSRQPFHLYLWNSAIVALSSTVLCLILAVPCSYGFVRGPKTLVRICGRGTVLCALFPYVFLFLGILEVVRFLGVANSLSLVSVLHAGLNLPFAVMMLRSYFVALPSEIEAAAQLDGYGPGALLWDFIIPLSLPAIVTCGMLCFIFSWNEFLFAATYISDTALLTIPVASARLEGSASMDVLETPYGVLSAATVVGTIPLVILVLIFQRRIIEGLTEGAVKG
jgi:multiple sugar transport system permease protein